MAGRFAAPAAAGKRVDTCGFYPLNSRFPLFLSLAQTRDRRPLRNRGTAEDFSTVGGAQCAPMSRPIRSTGYHTTTQTVYSAQARHARVAQLVSLEFADSTYGLDVWYNLSSQTLSIITRSRIARHCYAAPCGDETTCVAVRYMTLRICLDMGAHCALLRKKKSSAVPLFAAVTCR